MTYDTRRLEKIRGTESEVDEWRRGRSTFGGTEKEHLSWLSQRYCEDVLFLARSIRGLENEIKQLKNKNTTSQSKIVIDRHGRPMTEDGWHLTGCVFCGSPYGCSCK